MSRKQFLPTRLRELKALLAGYAALNGTIIALAGGAALVGVIRVEAPQLEKLLLALLAYSASMVYWFEFTWKPSGLSMMKWIIACAAVGGAFANAVLGPHAATGVRSPLVLLVVAAVATLLGYVITFLVHADGLAARWATTMSSAGLARVISEEESDGATSDVPPADLREDRADLARGRRALGLGFLVALLLLTRRRKR